MAEFLSQEEIDSLLDISCDSVDTIDEIESSKKQEEILDYSSMSDDDIFKEMMESFSSTLESIFSLIVSDNVSVKLSDFITISNKELSESFSIPSYINLFLINKKDYILSSFDLITLRILIGKMLDDSKIEFKKKNLLSPIESSIIKKFDYLLIQSLEEFLGTLIYSKINSVKITYDINSIGSLALDFDNYLVSFSFKINKEECLFSLYFPMHAISKYINSFKKIKGV